MEVTSINPDQAHESRSLCVQNATLRVTFNASYGLIEVGFAANDSSAVGKTAYVTAGQISQNLIPLAKPFGPHLICG